MSAGTSGILPSGVWSAYDGSTRIPAAASADPMWLSTNGGSVVGNVGVTGNLTVSGNTTLTGPVAMPGGITPYPFSAFVAPGTAGYITFGLVRIWWAQQTTGSDGGITTTLPPFASLATAVGIPQNAENVLIEYNTVNAAAGTIRLVAVDSTAPHPPAGAGIPVQMFGVVLLAPPAP